MSRPKKTISDRRLEVFTRSYKIGKASTGFQEPDVARALGISDRSLRRNKRSLNAISVEQFITLGKVFNWSDEDFLEIIRAEARR